jgi:hypothetical protein
MVQETRQDMERLNAQLRSVENIDQKQLERAVQKTRMTCALPKNGL